MKSWISLLAAAVLSVASLSCAFAAADTGDAKAPVNDPAVVEAQRRNLEAQTAYYRKLAEDRPFLAKVRDDPAALTAIVAAVVALLSFIFNYRATTRNQVDTQFYEAMKRFGDGTSATLRASAAGILAQMGKSRAATLSWRWPFFSKYPYLRTAFDQLVTGSRLESDHVSLDAIGKAIRELTPCDRKKAWRLLYEANRVLCHDLAQQLAELFVSETGMQKEAADDENPQEIGEAMWEQAASITGIARESLRRLKPISSSLQELMESSVYAHRVRSEKQRVAHKTETLEALRASAARLRDNARLVVGSLERRWRWSLATSVSLRFRRLLPMFHAQLAHTTLHKRALLNAWLDNCDFNKARFLNANVMSTRLRDCNFDGAWFSDSRLSDVNLENSTLRNTRFSNCRINDTDFSVATSLTGLAFFETHLLRVKMIGQDLSGVDFTFCEFHSVALDNAKVEGARFYGATFDSATSLVNVKWWKADFSGTSSARTDESLLEWLYERYGHALKDVDIDSEVHPSARTFLRSKIARTTRTPVPPHLQRQSA